MNQSAYNPAALPAGLLATMGIVYLVFFIFSVVIAWRICGKAGYNGALSLLLFVPLANLVFIIVFAFSRWPIQKELDAYRSQTPEPSGGYLVR